MPIQKNKIPYICFSFFLLLNIGFWWQTHKVQTQWGNVPRVPTFEKASLFTLGDKQFAYRIYALTLQNIGSIGGRGVSLKQYDYETLKNWFFLADYLDPKADIVPMLAAHYFGAIEDADKLQYVFDYLSHVGARPDGEKWRWLGHGVFLAKHVLKDNDKALEMAQLLASNKSPDLADWAKQMPAFILQEQGQAELAYKIMLNILISNIDTLHPNEINYMQGYICDTLVPELTSTPKPNFCIE